MAWDMSTRGQYRASTTVTATDTAATGVDLGTIPGTGPRTHAVRFIWSAANQASGSGVWTPNIRVSNDNSTWINKTAGDEEAITLTTTAQSGQALLRFNTGYRYAQATMVLSGSPVTPTITWEARAEL